MLLTDTDAYRETDDIPPDSQLTNPDGRVILGFLDDKSPGLNLQLGEFQFFLVVQTPRVFPTI